MLQELGIPLVGPPVIFTDSQSVYDNVRSKLSVHPNKHFDTKLQNIKKNHHIINDDTILICKIQRELNWADSLCKSSHSLTKDERIQRFHHYFATHHMHNIPNPLGSFAPAHARIKNQEDTTEIICSTIDDILHNSLNDDTAHDA